jgi:hypothetical protein
MFIPGRGLVVTIEMAFSSRVPVLAALVVLLLSATAHAAAPHAGTGLPGNRFPVTEHDYFLTGEAGGAPGGLLLGPASPAAQGQIRFLVPGVSALGVIDQPNAQSWYSTVGWDKDLEVTNDSVANLYFVANAQATTIFDVRLYDVAADGHVTLVDSDQQQFLTALSSKAIAFPLHTSGVIVHKGHVLRLEVTCETLTAAVFLQYGGATPSGMTGLATRWLDSDGDGLPDSDEVAVGRNPLNANDPVPAIDEGKDSDGDGLSDRTETTIGTDPAKVDTDGDGYGDGLEVHAGTNPLDAASVPYDSNHNGLPDSFETTYFNNTTITSTTGPCTPGPGCVDPSADPDRDGCDNLCEAVHGTDPNNPDTDGDSVSDGDELTQRTDPTSAASVIPASHGIPEPVATAAAFAIASSIVLVALVRRP